jgi:hypothetical protein
VVQLVIVLASLAMDSVVVELAEALGLIAFSFSVVGFRL